ncbi:hypothetical protein V8C44DRAFT_249296 [Trichoderma aethiopicum]
MPCQNVMPLAKDRAASPIENVTCFSLSEPLAYLFIHLSNSRPIADAARPQTSRMKMPQALKTDIWPFSSVLSITQDRCQTLKALQSRHAAGLTRAYPGTNETCRESPTKASKQASPRSACPLQPRGFAVRAEVRVEPGIQYIQSITTGRTNVSRGTIAANYPSIVNVRLCFSFPLGPCKPSHDTKPFPVFRHCNEGCHPARGRGSRAADHPEEYTADKGTTSVKESRCSTRPLGRHQR